MTAKDSHDLDTTFNTTTTTESTGSKIWDFIKHAAIDTLEVSPVGLTYELVSGNLNDSTLMHDTKGVEGKIFGSATSTLADNISNAGSTISANIPQSVKNVVGNVETGVEISGVVLAVGAAGLLYLAYQNRESLGSYAKSGAKTGFRVAKDIILP